MFEKSWQIWCACPKKIKKERREQISDLGRITFDWYHWYCVLLFLSGYFGTDIKDATIHTRGINIIIKRDIQLILFTQQVWVLSYTETIPDVLKRSLCKLYDCS